MADNDIEIKVTVDADGAIKAFDKLDQEVGDFDKTIKSSEGGITSFQGKIIAIDSALNIAGRAFSTLQSLAGSLFSTLDRAAVVEGVRGSFENLQASVGANASESFPALQKATKGLVSDFDLMQAANKAVLLGVDQGKGDFDDLAVAAVKLGAAMGQDAAKSVDDVTTALGRGSVMILDNLGVTLKMEDAQKRYAEILNKSVEELTEYEKKQAFVVVGTEKIIEKASELNDIQLTAAQSSTILANSFQNATDAFALGLSSSTDLGSALQNLSVGLRNVDWESFGERVGAAAAKIIELANVINETLQYSLPRLEKGIRSITKSYAEFFPVSDQVEESLLKIVDLQGQDTPEAIKKAMKGYEALAKAVKSNTVLDVAYGDQLNEIFLSLNDQAKRLGLVAEVTTKKTIPATEKLIEQTKASVTSNTKQADSFDAVIQAVNTYAKNVDLDLLPKIKDLIKEQVESGIMTDKNKKALEELAREYIKAGGDVDTYKDTQARANQELVEANKAANELSRDGLQNLEISILELSKLDLDTIFSGIGAALEDGFGDIQNSLANSIGNVITDVLNGDSARESVRNGIADLYGSIGETVGSVFGPIGSAIGGSIGEAIGDTLGKEFAEIGKSHKDTIEGIGLAISSSMGFIDAGVFAASGFAIGKAFFGKEKNVEFRESFAKFVQDSLEGLKLDIAGDIIDIDEVFSGQEAPQFWRDLATAIQGTTEETAFVNDAFRGFFENIRTDTAEGVAVFDGFLGVGNALKSLFPDLAVSGEQLGAILGKNLGADLNNLQILLGELNISQEDFAAAIEKSWLTGDISAKEYLKTNEQIEEVYKKGIPGAIGATNEALNNFISGGLTSGRLAWDALGDVGSEALEKNINSLDDLRADLIASGADIGSVDKFIQALADNGITNMEQLADVTVDQAARITDAAENFGLPFEKAEESLEKVKEKLDAIEEEKYVKIFVEYVNVNEPSPGLE